MPQAKADALMNNPSQIRGLPLCFYGCPKTATMRPRSTDNPYASSITNSYYRGSCPDTRAHSSSTENNGSSLEKELTRGGDSLYEDDELFPPLNSDSEEDNDNRSGVAELHRRQRHGRSRNNSRRRRRRHNQHSSYGRTRDSEAAICASLNSVESLLSESVLAQKLSFPGDENFGDSSHGVQSDASFPHAESAALISQAPSSTYHNCLVVMSVLLLLLYS